MNRRTFLKTASLAGAAAVALAGVDLYSNNKEPVTESQTTTTTSRKSLPYVEIDTSLAEHLDALYSMTAGELVKGKTLLVHSPNKTFNDLVSMPGALMNLKSYFDAVPGVRDGMLQLFTTLESQDKTYDGIDNAINSINSAAGNLLFQNLRSNPPFIFTNLWRFEPTTQCRS